MPPHSLTNLEIIDYFSDEPRFNGVYFRDNLPKTIKVGSYNLNLQDNLVPGSHWVTVFLKSNKVTYFNSFGVEYIPKEVKKCVANKDIKTNIFRIQDYTQ